MCVCVRCQEVCQWVCRVCQWMVHLMCISRHISVSGYVSGGVSGGVSVGGASNNMFVNTFLFQVSEVCLGICLQVYLLAPPASGETTTASFQSTMFSFTHFNTAGSA